MTAVLQSYADRGVFRGFRAMAAGRGRINYEFVWLTRRPMAARFETRSNTLTFPALLPAVGKSAAADAMTVLESIGGRGTPAHKRLDARRATVSGATRRGKFSLAVTIRGNNHAYAVKAALNLINEIFVTLHERHPDYLIDQFGISAE